MKMKKELRRTNLFTIILMAITAVSITVSACMYTSTNYLLVIPLYLSLFIAFLQARLIRYAYLLGGINSILYFFVYMYSGIPATAFFALLFSFPLQIITFIRWTKNKRGSSTALRKMNLKQRLGATAFFFTVWMAVFFALRIAGSDFALLDTTSSLLSMFGTMLTVLAFTEYTVVNVMGNAVSLSLYIDMISSGKSEQVPFLVYSVYSLICAFMAAVHAKRLYEKQCEEAKTRTPAD